VRYSSQKILAAGDDWGEKKKRRDGKLCRKVEESSGCLKEERGREASSQSHEKRLLIQVLARPRNRNEGNGITTIMGE